MPRPKTCLYTGASRLSAEGREFNPRWTDLAHNGFRDRRMFVALKHAESVGAEPFTSGLNRANRAPHRPLATSAFARPTSPRASIEV